MNILAPDSRLWVTAGRLAELGQGAGVRIPAFGAAALDGAVAGRLPVAALHEIHAEADDAANGYYQALVEARIPFSFADERQLEPEYIGRYKVLVLANIAALSDRQCAQIRDYVNRGGAIVATDETSLYDEWGKRRANFALADLFGCDFAGKVAPRVQNSYMTVRGPGPMTLP